MTNSMIKRYSMAEARSKFRELVRQVRAGKTVEVTRRGERVAVLIGYREYERLSRPAQCFSAAWNDFACKIDLFVIGHRSRAGVRRRSRQRPRTRSGSVTLKYLLDTNGV